ncbi:MAG TPA: hypothetical protein PKO40_04905 [Dokdonella sp.]|uniref:hypothetical protein n=1 Tax=Dokdonella sp. TaxID=2291710 RepID=UPI002BACF625|nr:hypothetical protein [Dokdonella sp.]HNV07825.1 hypothetical protein [Dokdonella sp.]HPW03395.1 hypothetical protein [Dokdonella sp.]
MRRMFGMMVLAGMLAMGSYPLQVSADTSVEQALFSAYQTMLGSRCATETLSRDEKGRQTRTQTEFDTLDRIRVSNDQVSFVILPEGTWMRSGDGEWMQPPIDMSAMFKALLPMTINEVRSGTRNIKDEGMKAVDGAELRAISYDLSTTIMGITVNSHVTVYLDEAGRIVRSESDGEAKGRKTHVVQTIRYDDSIRITAPK